MFNISKKIKWATIGLAGLSAAALMLVADGTPGNNTVDAASQSTTTQQGCGSFWEPSTVAFSDINDRLLAEGDLFRVCGTQLQALIVEDDHMTTVSYSLDADQIALYSQR